MTTMLPHDWLASCNGPERPSSPVRPPFRDWFAARRLLGKFVVVETHHASCVGILNRVGLVKVSIVLADGTLWTERWRDVTSVRSTSRPAFLRVIEAAGRVA
jgi:hypothetical protein